MPEQLKLRRFPISRRAANVKISNFVRMKISRQRKKTDERQLGRVLDVNCDLLWTRCLSGEAQRGPLCMDTAFQHIISRIRLDGTALSVHCLGLSSYGQAAGVSNWDERKVERGHCNVLYWMELSKGCSVILSTELEMLTEKDVQSYTLYKHCTNSFG